MTDYEVTYKLYYGTQAAADIKFQLVASAATGDVRLATWAIAPGAAAFSNIAIATTLAAPGAILSGSNGEGFVQMNALIQMGANAANITLQWAQNTANASNTTLYAGSNVTVRT